MVTDGLCPLLTRLLSYRWEPTSRAGPFGPALTWCSSWSGWRDLNPRPLDPQMAAKGVRPSHAVQ